MPKYYKGEISGLHYEVRDQYRWRRLFPKWVHYYIGESIKLIISIERLEPGAPNFSRVIIAEKLPSSTKYIPRKPEAGGRAGFTTVEFPIRGHILDTSGDSMWRLEVRSETGEIKKWTRIFDASIANRDVQRRDFILVALAFIFGLPSCFVTLLIGLATLWFEYQMYLQGLRK
jgi:hypothetical protein